MLEYLRLFIAENTFFVTFFLFLFGACIGSFLNVCIYRMPDEEKSIVSPGSYCPHCKTPLRWYDNLPIIGYAFLKGRCRTCREQISPRYIFVEVLVGYIFVQYFNVFGLSPQYIAAVYLTCSLLVATFVDFKWHIIPDEINFAGMIVGCVLAFFFPSLFGEERHLVAFMWAAVGLLVGGGSIYLTGVIGDFIFRKESMGGGDVKLMAMIGAFLGWKYVLLTFFLAPFFGSVIGIYAKYVQKKEIIPYGPFLSCAALCALFAGDRILHSVWGL